MSEAQFYLKLDDVAFSRFVDKLSSQKYRDLLRADPQFEARVNGHDWQTKTLRDVRPQKVGGELATIVKEMNAEDARPEREANDRLRAQIENTINRLQNSLMDSLRLKNGVSDDVWKWLKINPRELMYMRSAGNTSLSKADIAVVKSVYNEFVQKIGRTFDEKERQSLMETMADCAGLGRCLDPRVESSWHASLALCKQAKLIGDSKPEPVAPKKVEPVKKEPTEAEKRYKYYNKIAVVWKGKSYTAADVERMGSDEYKRLVAETGYDGGKIARSFSQLLTLPGRGE